MADKLVPVVEKRLMDVKLGQLGTWLGGRNFTPYGIIASILRGWERYQNKYITVKKGGIGGIAMIMVGYTTFCYMSQYDHLKQDRWRKHH